MPGSILIRVFVVVPASLLFSPFVTYFRLLSTVPSTMSDFYAVDKVLLQLYRLQYAIEDAMATYLMYSNLVDSHAFEAGLNQLGGVLRNLEWALAGYRNQISRAKPSEARCIAFGMIFPIAGTSDLWQNATTAVKEWTCSIRVNKQGNSQGRVDLRLPKDLVPMVLELSAAWNPTGPSTPASPSPKPEPLPIDVVTSSKELRPPMQSPRVLKFKLSPIPEGDWTAPLADLEASLNSQKLPDPDTSGSSVTLHIYRVDGRGLHNLPSLPETGMCIVFLIVLT